MAKRLCGSWHLSSIIGVQAILSLLFMLDGCALTQKRPNRQVSYEKIPFSEIIRSPEHYRVNAQPSSMNNSERIACTPIIEDRCQEPQSLFAISPSITKSLFQSCPNSYHILRPLSLFRGL